MQWIVNYLVSLTLSIMDDNSFLTENLILGLPTGYMVL